MPRAAYPLAPSDVDHSAPSIPSNNRKLAAGLFAIAAEGQPCRVARVLGLSRFCLSMMKRDLKASRRRFFSASQYLQGVQLRHSWALFRCYGLCPFKRSASGSTQVPPAERGRSELPVLPCPGALE